MQGWLARVAPRASSKANLAWDCLALFFAVAGEALFLGAQAPWSELLAVWVVAAGLWGVGGFILRFYDPWANRLAIDDVAMQSLLVMGQAIALLVWDFVAEPGWRPRIAYAVPTLWALVVGGRLLLFRRLMKSEPPLDDVLIVGAGALGRCTAEDLARRTQPRRRVVGFLSLPEEKKAEKVNGIPVLGDISEFEQVLRMRPVAEVYFAMSPSKYGPALQTAVRICERLGMPFAIPASPVRLERARPKTLQSSDGYQHFIHVRSNVYEAAVKRLFDIVVSTAGLFVLSPLLLGVAAAIKLTSRGPVFFKQERVGLHGRPFHMFKFRSMVVNADALKDQLLAKNEQSGPVFKMKNDPRVTKVGRFIRKFSIDELPQLLNVLRGEMSIVGPRPPVPREVVQYEPWQRRRLSVRPGLTCIWQVSGRNQITFEQWMYLDMQYIDHWSLTSDLSLVLKTVPVVITGKGAS